AFEWRAGCVDTRFAAAIRGSGPRQRRRGGDCGSHCRTAATRCLTPSPRRTERPSARLFLESRIMNPTDAKQLSLALTAPFPAEAVHWNPLAVRGNRALAAAYLDARAVMQRLDAVFGVGGWKDAYQLVNGGSVVCTLSVKVDGEWIDKTDVGSPSEQPDDGDKLKAAFSDALKRAAIKLGIGRYLYRLPRQWVDYDAQAKQ